MHSNPKFVVIVNNNVHSKDGVAASTGRILQSMGHCVTYVRIDPHLNSDAGNLSPINYGEVFVMEDGTEAPMCAGIAERFLGVQLTSKNVLSCGRALGATLRRERSGSFNAKSVRLVPHVVGAIIEHIYEVANTPVMFGGVLTKPTVCVVETNDVLDINSFIVLEAIKIFLNGGALSGGADEFCFSENVKKLAESDVLTVLVSSKSLKRVEKKYLGINVDVTVRKGVDAGKVSVDTDLKSKKKVSGVAGKSCGCGKSIDIVIPEYKNIYEVPLQLVDGNYDAILRDKLKIEGVVDRGHLYENYVGGLKIGVGAQLNIGDKLVVGIVGKYVNRRSAYLSVVNSLFVSAQAEGVAIEIKWVDSTDLIEGRATMGGIDAVLVPGGFGTRGTDGMIEAIRVARVDKIPFLGICYGMQLAVVEFCRGVLKMEGATTEEIDPNCVHQPVRKLKLKRASIRLGNLKVGIEKGGVAERLYGKSEVAERHRHCFGVTWEYAEKIREAGMSVEGVSVECPEIISIPEHPFFVGVQYHPEFTAVPGAPHPLFSGLIRAACENRRSVNKQ